MSLAERDKLVKEELSEHASKSTRLSHTRRQPLQFGGFLYCCVHMCIHILGIVEIALRLCLSTLIIKLTFFTHKRKRKFFSPKISTAVRYLYTYENLLQKKELLRFVCVHPTEARREEEHRCLLIPFKPSSSSTKGWQIFLPFFLLAPLLFSKTEWTLTTYTCM